MEDKVKNGNFSCSYDGEVDLFFDCVKKIVLLGYQAKVRFEAGVTWICEYCYDNPEYGEFLEFLTDEEYEMIMDKRCALEE